MAVALISGSPVCPKDQVAVVTTYQGADSLRNHALGFMELSVVAARAALENKTAIDSITPSIIYAIRHSVELFLKHVITELSDKCGAPISSPTGHNLLALFSRYRPDIKAVLDDEAGHSEHVRFDRHIWLSEFEDILKKLHQIDPDGQSLRYPADRDDEPNLGGTMPVSIGQLEQFAQHATACFTSYSQRCC